jgi:hypothetical protein
MKKKTSTPTLISSDDDISLLDDDESPLIKDGSPSPTEFSGVEEEITQMCLPPKEVVFKKPEELS